MILLLHLVVIIFRQSFHSEGRCLFSFILWKTNYLDINFLIYWRYSLRTAWQKKGLPKSLCKKESSRKSVQNYYLLLEGLQEKIPSFSPSSRSTYSSLICIRLVRRSSLRQPKRALASFPTVAPLEPSLITHLSSIW